MSNGNDRNGNGRRVTLSPSTFVSFGVLVSIVGGTWIVANKLSQIDTAILSNNTALKAEFSQKATTLEARVTALEGRQVKESWTDGDMFRWATRLQRENQNLRVPEPPMKADSQNR
jgi:hypothetical protein